MVCDRCNDTHLMTLGDREVMCTACPTPCQKCRARGNGPYCATTPCSCECHGTKRPTDRDLLQRAAEALQHLKVCRQCGEDNWSACLRGGQDAEATLSAIEARLEETA